MAEELSDFKHDRGVVSTVRIPGKAWSDGSQFFICVSPQPSLDGQFSSFGKVTEGVDVAERISQMPAGANGIADKPVRIVRVTVEPKKVEPFLDVPSGELSRTVLLKTTLGSIPIRMEPDWAPEHARNFLKLASTGWFNGTGFHRVMKGFVVQGGMGNTRANASGHAADRWVKPLKGEFRQDVKHERGIVSMARTDDPNSAMTSFFLMLGPAPHLDGQYSAFGKVVEGMEVLDLFEKEEVDGETPKRRLEILEAAVEPEGAP